MALIAGLVLGFFGGALADRTRPPDFFAGMKGALEAKCVSSPAVLEEIEKKLPDNNEGLITPEILRHVLRDVVNHC
jgi:hypothetical protein